ncbi:MAG: hypothetical protein AB7E52_06290, partial [Bdellovibrionales bacterium]
MTTPTAKFSWSLPMLIKSFRLLALGALLVASVLSVLAFGTQAYAQTPAAAETTAAQLTPQEDFIQKLGTNAVSILSDKTLSPEQQNEKFLELLRGG